MLDLRALCPPGCHGTAHVETELDGSDWASQNERVGWPSRGKGTPRPSRAVHLGLTVAEDGLVTAAIRSATSAVRMRGHVSGDHSYLQLLFDNDEVN